MDNELSVKIESRYKFLSAEQKLIETLKLYYLAKELKRGSLKTFHPELTHEEIENKVKEIFINARS